MAEEIYGPYSSVEEAVKTVNVLELEGYFKENITIFSHGKHADKLNRNADVTITSTETSSNREQSFMDKISNVIFSGVEETTDIHEKLLDKGLSDKQAAQYAEQIKSGNILVTADRALKMGNDPTEEMNETNMKESISHVQK
ncbi:general stress protein [Lentibacillus jeotgali]|uniref:general stress protein n=1 Tax=Lentibacillus jeotgali TaxID=558169 RepID=UPI00026267FC|nr:general stress protein [Lentibacillus jeotgali]